MNRVRIAVLAVALLVSATTVVGVGVTQSWFSDTESTDISIETGQWVLSITKGDSEILADSDGIYTLETGEYTINSNYAASVSVTLPANSKIQDNNEGISFSDGKLTFPAGEHTFTVGGSP